MKFDLENLNPGTWFDFPDGEGRICLRTLSFEEATAIAKQTTKKQREYKNGQRYEWEDTDNDKQFDMTWKACIVGWEGVYSADGKEVPCTDEYKVRLMRRSPLFAQIIRGFLEQLKEAEEKQTKEVERNL